MSDTKNEPEKTSSGNEQPSVWYWLKNDKGKMSVSSTLVAVSFWATTLAYVVSAVEKVGPVVFKSFDVAACGSYFGLILATYTARKFTDAKYPETK